MGLNAGEIEAALRAALPPELQGLAPALALQLANIVAEPLIAGTSATQMAVEPGVQSLLQLLAGQQIKIATNGPLLSFGQGNQFGNIAIGDVAGGNIVKINVTLTSRPPIGVPFLAPALPPHFVPRSDVSTALKQQLLNEIAAVPGVLQITAIHALGGSGKSVIAAALAHDPAVQARFPDGVLWVTLTQQPNLTTMLRDWIRELGDYDFQPASIATASTRLRSLLQDKSCLLIVDDAWDAAHIQPFLASGSQCRVLITTRRAYTANKVGAKLYELGGMAPQESLALFETRLGHRISDAERDQALLLAKALGYLPLALELAAVRVAQGTAWKELHDAFEEEVARLEELEEPIDRLMGELRLGAVLNLSLRALLARVEVAWRAFAWLGVLPEDAVIAAPMASTLCGRSESETNVLLELLWGEALLIRGEPRVIEERSWPSYRLHDLLHDTARRLLVAPQTPSRDNELPGLGLTLSKAHTMLLERYRERTDGGRWHTVLDDGYFYNHLAYHLEAAQCWGQLRELFADDEWLQKRFIQQNWIYDGYLADVEIAQAHAEVEARIQIAVHDEPAAIADCLHYALVHATVTSLAGNYVPALVACAVETELEGWPVQRGLSLTRRIADPQRRAQMGIALLGVLPDTEKARAELQQITLDAVRTISLPRDRSAALAALALQLDGQPTLLSAALDVALAIDLPVSRSAALAALAPHLAESERATVLTAALDTARIITSEVDRSTALATLALQLAGQSALLAAALDVAGGIRDRQERDRAFAALAPQLARESTLRTIALNAARSISDERERARSLAALAPQLAGQSTLLAAALEDARAVTDNWERSRALAALAPHLAESERATLLAAALDAARSIDSRLPGLRSRALANLAPRLDESERAHVLAAALDAIRHIGYGDDSSRTLALQDLAPQLVGQPALISDALKFARAIGGARERSAVLAALVPQLAEFERYGVLTEALDAACTIKDQQVRSAALATLAPHLVNQPVLLTAALNLARAIYDEPDCSRALAALAPQLAEPERVAVLAGALDATRAITDESVRARSLTALVAQLDRQPALLSAALDAARTIASDWERDRVLAALVPHLAQQSTLLSTALDATRTIVDERVRSAPLSTLAPQLAGKPTLLSDALKLAHAIRGERERSATLAALALQLAEPKRATVLNAALDAARAISDERERARSLAALAPKLAGQPTLLAAALEDISAVTDDWERSRALAALAPQLAEPKRAVVLAAALNAARAIPYDGARSTALAALASQLADQPIVLAAAFDTALKALHTIGDEGGGMEALAILAPQLVGQPALLAAALDTVRSIRHAVYGREALAILAPQLVGQPALLVAALDIARTIRTGDYWKLSEVLAALASRLAEAERTVVLAAALDFAHTIGLEWARSRGLATLAPQLADQPMLLATALDVAQTITNEQERSAAMAALISQLADSERVLAIGQLRYQLLTLLQQRSHDRRESVLRLCADTRIFGPPLVEASTLTRIAQAIIAVCHEWRWP